MKMLLSLGTDTEFTEMMNGDFGLTISNTHGHISVITGSPYSPAKHSITDFVVDDKMRKQGHGEALLKEAIRRFGEDLGGQASSKASVSLMYKNGFRMAVNPRGSLEEALEKMREDSSVYMRLKKH